MSDREHDQQASPASTEGGQEQGVAVGIDAASSSDAAEDARREAGQAEMSTAGSEAVETNLSNQPSPRHKEEPGIDATPIRKTAKGAQDLHQLLAKVEEQLRLINLQVKDFEELVLCKVFLGLHQAYYDSWTHDARYTIQLAARLKRRIHELKAHIASKAA